METIESLKNLKLFNEIIESSGGAVKGGGIIDNNGPAGLLNDDEVSTILKPPHA